MENICNFLMTTRLRKCKTLFLSLLFIAITYSISFGQSAGDYRSKSSGDWGTTSTWEVYSGGWVDAGSPPSGSSTITVTVRNGHTVSQNTDYSTGGNNTIVVENGATLNMTGATGNFNFASMTVSGTLKRDNSSYTFTGTPITMQSGSTYQHAINGGIIPTSLNFQTGSTCEITGVTSTKPTNLSATTFSNFTWNCSGQTGKVYLNGDITDNVTGNFTVTNTGYPNALRFAGNSDLTVTIGGDLIINGASAYLQFAWQPLVSYAYVLNIGGSYNQSSGIFKGYGDGTFTPIETHFTGSNKGFSFFGGTMNINNMNWTVDNVASLTINNNFPTGSNSTFTVDGTLTTGTKIITGSANFVLSSGATLKIGNPKGITTSGLKGNIQVSGTRTYSSSANYIYNGTASQITNTGLPSSMASLTIDNAIGVTVSSSRSTGSLILTSGILTTSSTAFVTVTGSSEGSVSRTTGYVKGPLARTLPASLSAGTAYSFPIGKSAYKPLELIDPTTTGGGTVVIKAEVFDDYAGGTYGTGITNLSTDRYWNATITSGAANFTNTVLRLTETGLQAFNRIGQSATLTGVYNSIGGIYSDPTITSENTITSLNYFVIGDGLYDIGDGDYTENFSTSTRDEWTIEQTSGTGLWTYASSMTDPALTPLYGTEFAYFNSNTFASGTSSRLISPTFDITGVSAPYLRFYMSQDAANPLSNDKIQVLISTNGGDSYTTLGDWREYGASYSIPDIRPRHIDLRGYSTTELKVAFQAVGDHGSSMCIDQVEIYDEACPAPTSPTHSGVTYYSAVLSWTSGGGDSYTIKYKVVGAPSYSSKTTTNTSFTLTTLSPSTDYEWYVQKYCSGETVGRSVIDYFTTLVDGCSPPTNLTASDITSTTAKLTWDGPPAATSYKVRYAQIGTTSFQYKTITVDSLNIGGLLSGTEYFWQIQTTCDDYVMAYTTADTFTTASAKRYAKKPELTNLISSNQITNIAVYPNPLQNNITISFSSLITDNYILKIYDMTGREVLNETSTATKGDNIHQLDLSAFELGVYTLVMEQKNFRQHVRIVKQ